MQEEKNTDLSKSPACCALLSVVPVQVLGELCLNWIGKRMLFELDQEKDAVWVAMEEKELRTYAEFFCSRGVLSLCRGVVTITF